SLRASAAFAADSSCIVWGDDDGALSTLPEDAIGGPRDRLARTWRVAETGETGALTVSFDLGSLGLTIDPSQVALLIDGDGNFANAVVYTAGRSVNGNIVSFSQVNLQDGQYLSLMLRGRPDVTVTNTPALTSVQ